MNEQVNQDVVVQPAGQPDQVSQQEISPEVAKPEAIVPVTQEPVQPTQPEPVLTEQKVLEIVNKAAKEAAAETLREVQSRTDKAEARIRKEVQDKIDGLKAIGVSLTNEQAAQLDAQTRQEFAQKNAPQPVNPLDQMRNELEQEFGLELSTSDLEAKLVTTDGTPTQFLRTYEQALKAKQDRLKAPTAKPVATPQQEEPTKARIVTSPAKGSGGIVSSDPDALFNMAYKKE